ncbi:MAG: hypothetical protein U1F49_06150 [Rubrivivax sp.]
MVAAVSQRSVSTGDEASATDSAVVEPSWSSPAEEEGLPELDEVPVSWLPFLVVARLHVGLEATAQAQSHVEGLAQRDADAGEEFAVIAGVSRQALLARDGAGRVGDHLARVVAADMEGALAQAGQAQPRMQPHVHVQAPRLRAGTGRCPTARR